MMGAGQGGHGERRGMKLETVGPVPLSTGGLVKQLRTACERLDCDPKLVFLFLPFGADSAAVLRAVSNTMSLPLIGGTTGGASFTERGITTTGAVAGVLGGGDLEVQLGVAENISQRDDALHQAVGGLNFEAGRHSALCCLVDAFACDGEEVVRQFGALRKPHVRLFGGTTGDDLRLTGKADVFINDRSISNAMVCAVLSSETAISLQVRHGFRVCEDARELQVTKIEGAHLLELNGKPAAVAYQEELQRLGHWDRQQDFLQVAALHELGAVSPFGEGLKIRATIALHPDKSLTLGGSLRLGESVRGGRGVARALDSRGSVRGAAAGARQGWNARTVGVRLRGAVASFG